MITKIEEFDWSGVSPVKPTDLKKWMRSAQFAKDNENPCLSRSIGVVIVDPRRDAVVSVGHNGPPENLPACDDPDYLKKVVAPQLTPQELAVAVRGDGSDDELRARFCKEYAGCGICPRRLIGAPSGQRLELCTCIHGETDAVTKARRPLFDCWMICACGVPCIDCTKIILEARMEVVVALEHGHGDYSPYSSRWMFERSNTQLIMAAPEWFQG